MSAHKRCPRPENLWPPYPWLVWAWRGKFVPGHTANQFMVFCLVGGSGVLVNAAVMWLLFHHTNWAEVPASIGAFLVANVNNFIWNKLFAFRDHCWEPRAAFRQYLRFMMVTLPGLAINEAVLILLIWLTPLDPVLANLAGVLVATVFNFLGSKYFAFKVGP